MIDQNLFIKNGDLIDTSVRINIEAYHGIEIKKSTWNEGKCCFNSNSFFFELILNLKGHYNYLFLEHMIMEKIEDNKQYKSASPAKKPKVSAEIHIN